MTTFHRFDIAELPATPWKNGGGSTREVLSCPPGAGFDDFEWRVSVASIAASGPFSVFAGVDRTIMLLEGDGVRLQGPGVEHVLDMPHEPFMFSGDAALDCALLGGASTDFNVMVRRAWGQAQVRVLCEATRWQASAALMMCVQGHWTADGRALEPGQGLWWAGATHALTLLPLGDDAKLVTVACSTSGNS